VIAAEPAPLVEFRERIAEVLGLCFEGHRWDFLAAVLDERCRARGENPSTYLRGLRAPAARDEWRVLADRLTVSETYFLRGKDHFDAFVQVVLPQRARATPEGGTLRFLSAGCSSGDEAYSMAILVRENAGLLAGRAVEILGCDVNRAILDKARAGRFSAWSLRETPAAVRDKYFDGPPRWTLSPEIRAMVSFREENLTVQEVAWPAGAFDAVFCRNVLMYLAPEKAAAVVERIRRALKPGGFLFLGHAETLRGLSQAFHLRRFDGAFYYQRKEAGETEPPEPAALPWSASLGGAVSPVDSSALWMERIEVASARIARLAAASRNAPPAARRVVVPRRNLDPVFDLHRQERFTEALAHLEGVTDAGPEDAGVRVLRAMLLVGCGKFAEAEALCRPLLAENELETGAHYVAALCREQAGDLVVAEEHDAAAIHLDPTFAMPRFHLGRLLKRLGRPEEALLHFDAARAAFLKEDSTRLLLFGGGFSRGSLLEICRGEIERLKSS
jgi:chemotaxis protein methyltransferase CheR